MSSASVRPVGIRGLGCGTRPRSLPHHLHGRAQPRDHRRDPRLGLWRRPDRFLANGYGALNAFAAQATGQDYVVLSNELFANLSDRNRDGLGFILGHELGHSRLHHVSLWHQLAVAHPQLRGFWVGLARLPRSHPFSVRRLEGLYRIGLFSSGPQQVGTRV